MCKHYPVLLREVKSSGSVQAHVAHSRFINEGKVLQPNETVTQLWETQESILLP